jgi:hypothetical protein
MFFNELRSTGFDLPNPQQDALVVTWDSSSNIKTVPLKKFSYKSMRTALRLDDFEIMNRSPAKHDIQEAEISVTRLAEYIIKRGRDLQSQLRLAGKVYVPPRGEIEGYGKGPWCRNCFDTNGILETLDGHPPGQEFISTDKWECPRCRGIWRN